MFEILNAIWFGMKVLAELAFWVAIIFIGTGLVMMFGGAWIYFSWEYAIGYDILGFLLICYAIGRWN